MTAFFPLLLWLSQLLLGVQCGCPTEGLTETDKQGTFVGAISPNEEAGSLGWFFTTDGRVLFENHAD